MPQNFDVENQPREKTSELKKPSANNGQGGQKSNTVCWVQEVVLGLKKNRMPLTTLQYDVRVEPITL
jgi:hypothetical protein